jgi:hypothetical protein
VYGNGLTRCAILVAFAILASQSPRLDRFPFTIDGWLFLGVREVLWQCARWLPTVAFGSGALAEGLAPWLPRGQVRVRYAWRWVLVLTVLAGVCFWLIRVPRSLGDYRNIDGLPIPAMGFEPSEALGQMLSTAVRMLGAAVGVPSSTALAVETIVFGATAVGALFLWSRSVSTQWALVFGMLMSSGFMVLFCGYVEVGTPKALAVGCWYLYFMTRAVRDGALRPLFLASACLSLAALIHGSALCWLPAHAWYVWRHTKARLAMVSVAGFLLSIAAFGVLCMVVRPWVFTPIGNIAAPLQWFKAYCVTNCGYDFWSISHLLDILNCLLVLSPMAVLCLPEAFWQARSVAARWLAVAALGWLFLSVIWFPVFGYVADWDIFAATPLVISCFAILVAIEVMPEGQFRRLAYAWIVVSGLHTLSWWYLFWTPL